MFDVRQTMPFRRAETITRKIRECCVRLDTLDAALREDAGITAAMQMVLYSLYETGVQTVPQIARSKGVTRQHIQVLADRLVEAGLAIKRDNPADRRSPLISLTQRGHALVEEVRQREIDVFTDLNRALKECDTDAAMATLDALQLHLARLATKPQ